MGKIAFGTGLVALVFALVAGTMPASAEFFGCNDRQSVRTISYRTHQTVPARRSAPRHSSTSRYTHEFAAQTTRPRVTIHPRATRPGPNSKRYCRSWLAQEYRVSGTVIVPRMQCWWQ